MQIRARVLLFIPVVLLLADTAMAQCRLEGVVRLADGTPAADATVRIEGTDYKKPLTTTTGPDGRYAFDDLKPGARVRVVVIRGGRQVTEAFALVTLRVERLDIQEQLAPSTPASTGDVLAAKGQSGDVGGIVRSASGETVTGARVAISQTVLSTETDAAGRYVFATLRPGIRVRLQVTAAGYKPATKDVVVSDGTLVEADITLEAAAAAGAAEGGLSELGAVAEADRVSGRPEQAAGIPSLGQRDLLRALQFLPGVLASTETSAELYVRGGTPDQNLITLDGFTLYPLEHAFGAFSAYNMDAIQKAEFSRSALSAADGGRLSGALRLTGRATPAGKVSGTVDLSALGGGGAVSVSLGNRGSFLLAARHSPPSSLYKTTLDYFTPGRNVAARDRAVRLSDGTTEAAPTSSFYDLNGKLELKLTSKDRFDLSFYDGRDEFNNSRDLPLGAFTTALHVVDDSYRTPSGAVVQASDIQSWKAQGFSGAWARQWKPSVSTTVSVGHSTFEKTNDQSSPLIIPSTGEDDTLAAGRGGYDGSNESNHLQDTTVRADSLVALGFKHALSIGGEFTALDADYANQQEVFQKLDSNGVPVTGLADLLRLADSGHLITAFVQDTIRPSGRLLVAPGLRLTHYDRASATYLEPRLSAAYQLTPIFRLTGGWAINHQVANRITREDREHGDGAFWALADGSTIPVAFSQQVVGGGTLEIRGYRLDVAAYYKEFEDLTLFAPRLYPNWVPADGSTRLYRGSGKARGVEVLFGKRSSRNTLWASYTMSRVEYTYQALEAQTFPAPYDRPHEAKITDAGQIWAGFVLSGAWVISSGRPYTPGKAVEQVWFPTGATAYQVTFGTTNAARLPIYHRLDLSLRRDFRFGPVRATAGATAFNVYNRKNVQFIDYQTAGTALNSNDILFMGRVFNVFLRVGF